MNRKAGYAFRIVLGGYLAYIGIRILMQMIDKRPSNMVFMSVMAVIFAVIGSAYAIYSLKKVWGSRKEETKSSEEEKTGADGAPEETADAAGEEREEMENNDKEK